jgi:hypothetical protein
VNLTLVDLLRKKCRCSGHNKVQIHWIVSELVCSCQHRFLTFITVQYDRTTTLAYERISHGYRCFIKRLVIG